MQQNTWRYQAFCYMIQHYNAYFKIVRLQKSKISIKMSLNIFWPHKFQAKKKARQKKNVRCQETKLLDKDSKTADNTIHGN
jgi:hypothetical protein